MPKPKDNPAEYEVECYDRFHALAMSEDPEEQVVGRFCKEFLQQFDDFEQSEAKRLTPPGALAVGEVRAAMMLSCGNAFALAKKGREEKIAEALRDVCEKVIAWHLEVALKIAKDERKAKKR